MTARTTLPLLILPVITLLALVPPVQADSSGPRLAAYYKRFLAICGSTAYEWRLSEAPRASMENAVRVGVGKKSRYVLTRDYKLMGWQGDPAAARLIQHDVRSFYAGQTGLFIVRNDSSLWYIDTARLLGLLEDYTDRPIPIASDVRNAAIGDSADYYVTRKGALLVKGSAHRGQYGDGKLQSTDRFVQTASNVVQVAAHTGHALVLKNDGTVWGTGGNIYGPLGQHGFGDKADTWGLVMGNGTAIAIATGASHSVAIDQDKTLWIWGRNEGLIPRMVLKDVTEVAASRFSTIALSDGGLWQWDTGEDPKWIMDCP